MIVSNSGQYLLASNSGITTISLTRGLGVLIENQLVEKYYFEPMPLHTEYQLTEKGKSLMPILRDLNQWGKEWL